MDHGDSFQRKSYGLNALDNFSLHFSIVFLFLAVFLVVLITKRVFVIFFDDL